MSDLTYLHEKLEKALENGNVVTYEELIKENSKGILIKFFSKDATKTMKKITITGKNNSFVMKCEMDGKVTTTDLTSSELAAELKKNKDLKFAVNFAKSNLGKSVMSRVTSKRGTKKGSKKGTKRRTKRGSKSRK